MIAPRSFLVFLASALSLVPAVATAAGQGEGGAGPVAAGLESARSRASEVRVVSDERGRRLRVDGKDFFVVGMNWDYVPIGQNYAYSLWTQPEEVIREALAREMPLLRRLGVNAIRQYAGVPKQWIRYIYETYGIYTVLNPTVGRYGHSFEGVWEPQVDYSNDEQRRVLKEEVRTLVEDMKDTPGLLFWLLGNENNYGLAWGSAAIDALPVGDRDAARARYLYSLFGEIIRETKALDTKHPVAIANGDAQYIDIVAEECQGLDLFGANVYRGKSARDFFEVVEKKLHVPVVFTEFGADAFDAKEGREDDVTQARYLVAQWEELYEQSAGKGRAGNAIGGFTFQWSDGWWKYKQDTNLEVHDPNASWPNGGYAEDFVDGANNMNEEWWGICAKGKPDDRGLFDLRPRTAYYALERAFTLDPYAEGVTLERVRSHFASIDPNALASASRTEAGANAGAEVARVRVSGVRASFETYSTGGLRRVRSDVPQNGDGSNHQQSFFFEFEAKPSEKLVANASVNVLGNVALNPIDELFYENRGRARFATNTATNPPTQVALDGLDRVKMYRATLAWDDDWFRLDAFYRAGHFHWQYEGDLFGLYREAYYGPNIDIYNADLPLGFEVAGKRSLEGLKLAMGPALWWGANPSGLLKYRHTFGPITATAIYTEQLPSQSLVVRSAAVPERTSRKATLVLAGGAGPWTFEGGAIWAGSQRVGETFYAVESSASGTSVLTDRIRATDTLGAKAKVTFSRGRYHAYAQGNYSGLVADGGPTSAITFTGWSLRDSGLGNQANAIAGVAVDVGSFQIGPNFLWQKPLVGPIPGGVAGASARNVLDDPFAVRANRETLGGELLVVYDPTPTSWFWAYDNDLREDASFAASASFAYRRLPTTTDSALGVSQTQQFFSFGAAPPAHDLWETNARFVANFAANTRLVGHAFGGIAQANGSSDRLVRRYGGDARIAIGRVVFATFLKFNDWGPYDYHRDFNLTYPVQAMGDLSTTYGTPRWLNQLQTRLGVRGTFRALNGWSNRFCPDPAQVNGDGTCNPLSGPAPWGNEWEVRTYLHFAL